MAENSAIEWTDHTFNPWIGCTKVSDGCKHCYAETLMDKRYGKVKWGPQGARVRTSKANWDKPRRWNEQAKKEGRRFRVFCASLADVFEEKPDQPEINEWRNDLFALIDATPNLDWLLLTKRPENIKRLWPFGWYGRDFTWPNVWMGTSVENQETADERIPWLLKIPAVVHFLSCEPLLGHIDLELSGANYGRDDLNEMVNWVIVGGESGPGARPLHPDWVRSIRDQCLEADTPFFFKQWGAWTPNHGLLNGTMEKMRQFRSYDQNRYVELDGVFLNRMEKKNAGRMLDGREWNQMPQVKHGPH